MTVYAEGDIVKVRGHRKLFRVTRIRFDGSVDCVDEDGRTRTFLLDLLTSVGAPVVVRNVGQSAPARKRGAR